MESPKTPFESPLSFGNLGSTLALATLAVAGLMNGGAILSGRPTGDEIAQVAALAHDEVAARLWEDPFEAAHQNWVRWQRESKERSGNTRKLPNSALWNVQLPDQLPGQVQLIPVLLPGGDGQYAKEFRMRVRTAFMDGMLINNWAPHHATHLSYWHLNEGTPMVPKELESLQDKGMQFLARSVAPGTWYQKHQDPDKPKLKIPEGATLIQPFTLPYEVLVSSAIPPKPTTYRGLGELCDQDAFTPRQDVAVVLWVDMDRLGKDWLSRLEFMMDGAAILLGSKAQQDWQLNVLGPPFSDHLLKANSDLRWRIACADSPRICPEMSTEVEPIKSSLDQDFPKIWAQKSIFSPWATMDSADILGFYQRNTLNSDWLKPCDRCGPETEADVLSCVFQRAGWQLNRTTTTDGDLRELLLSEIAKRIPGDDKTGTVAILAEADSAYGLSWLKPPGSGSISASSLGSGENILWQDIQKKMTKSTAAALEVIDGLVFLRGLDGTGLRIRATANQQVLDESAALEAYPFGTGQIDSLRRYLNELSVGFEKIFPTRTPPTAVGVFGVDVFDKITLLAALRPYFQDSVFFTVDMDSRFFHPRHAKVARNLVVAAHFDLQLNKKLQGGLPPFRDSYQTATYYGVLRLLGIAKDCQNSLPLPRLFEIGDTRAVELSMSGKAKEKFGVNLGLGNKVRDLGPHPKRDRSSPIGWLYSWEWVGILAILIGVLLYADTVVLPGRLLAPAFAKLYSTPALCLGLILYLGAWAIMLLSIQTAHQNAGEPFSWTSGASAWPTEIFRLIGIGLGVSMILLLNRRFQQSLTAAEDRSFGAKIKTDSWSHALDKSFEKTWADFAGYGREEREFLLCLGGALVACASYGVLVLLTDWPNSPVRGDYARNWNLFLMPTSVFLLFVLVTRTLRHFRAFSVLLRNLHSEKLPMEGSWATYHAGQSLAEKVQRLEMEVGLVQTLSPRVYSLIYFPSLLLLVLGLARSSYFDAWVWPVAMVLMIAATFLTLLLSGMILRQHARKFRNSRIRALDDLKHAIEFPVEESDAGRAELAKIRRIRDELKALHTGVFSSVLNDPILRAMLVPLSGLGALALLQGGAMH
jgi:hypothetical protein